MPDPEREDSRAFRRVEDVNAECSMDVDAIPVALRERDQWVCWREEQRDRKPTKIPVTPGAGSFASATDPETWSSFEAVLDYAEAGKADGVGFVFTDDDPIVGVDLDDCRDPETGDVDDTARDIIERLDSYLPARRESRRLRR